MTFIIFALLLLSIVFSTDGQGYYGLHNGVLRHRRIPDWCPTGSPRISCGENACRGEVSSGCPNYPYAVCVNDNPCEPRCIGHYYVGAQRRLTTQQCGGIGGDAPDVECPPTRIRCALDPCYVARCPRYPNAVCVRDNPCEPCIAHFYDGNTQLTRRECRRNRRRHRQN